MTSNASYRRTAIWVASLWLLTAFGAIAGTAVMNSVLTAPDYLTTIFPQSTTVISGMLLWLINDFGIVFIGLLMFPILKQQSERMALTYLSMRMFEAIFLIVGVIFAMLLIPLSHEYIKAGTADVTTYQAIGTVLKQAEYWFMTPMQLIPLGLGGVVLTAFLYRTKLVPRFISVIGFIGYALLLPSGILTLLGILDTLPGAPGSVLVIPVALFEIILMPIWLYAKGFNRSAIASEFSETAAKNPLLSAA
ncbi:MAG: DUF4386 domain-containing protein [Chloroflexota bacterium]